MNVNLWCELTRNNLSKNERILFKAMRCWSHRMNQWYGVAVCLPVVKMLKINNGFERWNKFKEAYMLVLVNVCCPHWNLIRSILNRYHSFTNHWLLLLRCTVSVALKSKFCTFDYSIFHSSVRCVLCAICDVHVYVPFL